MYALIAHGGAGQYDDTKKAREGIKKAVKKGEKTLKKKKGSLKAVEDTIRELEDIKIFNAGNGSALTKEGEIEMDASLVTSNKKIGSVANIKDIKHPITLAKYVLKQTEHVFMGGEGINRLAEKEGFKKRNPYTKKRIEERKEKLRKISVKEKSLDTVGAVAIDQREKLVAGTSTGGISLKMEGRVGDSPLFGAGTYADKETAFSATGHGESIIKTLLTKKASKLTKKYGLKTGLKKSIEELENMVEEKKNPCGMISINNNYEFWHEKNTKHLPVAMVKKDEKIETRI